MKYLSKNEKGIEVILDIIKGLRTKNLNFFKNTFNFYLTNHPPYPNSQMCYDFEKNDYKFVSNSKLKNANIVTFEDYIPGDPNCLIKEHSFYYSVLKPHVVIIADANWILKLASKTNKYNLIENRDEAASGFFAWYEQVVEDELKSFKNILTDKETKREPIKRLF